MSFEFDVADLSRHATSDELTDTAMPVRVRCGWLRWPIVRGRQGEGDEGNDVEGCGIC